MYGKELILDLHNCNVSLFNRKDLRRFFKELCARIKMSPEKLVWWDDVGVPVEEQETEPHLKGTTAVQFIKTSNVTIHTLELLGSAYLNIFSCKDFDPDDAADFCEMWFEGENVASQVVERI